MTRPIAQPISTVNEVDLNTPPEQVARLMEQDGVLIVRKFINTHLVQRLRADIDPGLQEFPEEPSEESEVHKRGINRKTKQLADLVNRSQVFREDILNHRWMHDLGNQLLGPAYGDHWLNRGGVYQVEPGEKAQLFHRDDVLYQMSAVRRPTDPQLMLNFIIALTEFTENNGATRVVPGSHLWENATDQPPCPPPEKVVTACMQPGDAVVFLGSLLHKAGGNTCPEARQGMMVSLIPCQFTPMDTHLHLSQALVETMTPLAQKMIGWRSVDTHHKYPIWLAGDTRVETVMGLKARGM